MDDDEFVIIHFVNVVHVVVDGDVKRWERRRIIGSFGVAANGRSRRP
jgi:hypothetical protein